MRKLLDGLLGTSPPVSPLWSGVAMSVFLVIMGLVVWHLSHYWVDVVATDSGGALTWLGLDVYHARRWNRHNG